MGRENDLFRPGGFPYEKGDQWHHEDANRVIGAATRFVTGPGTFVDSTGVYRREIPGRKSVSPAPVVQPSVLFGRLTSVLYGVNTSGNTGNIISSLGATFQPYLVNSDSSMAPTGPELVCYPPPDLYSGFHVNSETYGFFEQLRGLWFWIVGECPVAN